MKVWSIKSNCHRLDVNFLYFNLNTNCQDWLSGKWVGGTRIRKIKAERILWCRMRLWDSEWPRNWGLDWEGEGWWLCLMLADLFLTENYNLLQFMKRSHQYIRHNLCEQLIITEECPMGENIFSQPFCLSSLSFIFSCLYHSGKGMCQTSSYVGSSDTIWQIWHLGLIW